MSKLISIYISCFCCLKFRTNSKSMVLQYNRLPTLCVIQKYYYVFSLSPTADFISKSTNANVYPSIYSAISQCQTSYWKFRPSHFPQDLPSSVLVRTPCPLIKKVLPQLSGSPVATWPASSRGKLAPSPGTRCSPPP